MKNPIEGLGEGCDHPESYARRKRNDKCKKKVRKLKD